MTNDELKLYIIDRLGIPELLCQLAEEAAELSKAALKLRRAITGVNPTPVTVEQARDNLIEEMADVDLCLELLESQNYTSTPEAQKVQAKKLPRWAGRLGLEDDGRRNIRCE
jgi:hypothetical protein